MTGRPSDAEVARTLVDGHLLAEATVPWLGCPMVVRHAPDDDGHLLLLLDANHPVARVGIAGARSAAVVTVWDVAPWPAPDRVRGRVQVGGQLASVAPELRRTAAEVVAARHGAAARRLIDGPAWVLRLEVTQVRLERDGRARPVTPEAYAAARPDPLAGREDAVLRHVLRSRPGVLGRLLPDAVAGEHITVRRLDRYGMDLDVDGVEARIVFPWRLRCRRDLAAALRELAPA
ncbi:MAG: hypothetical protein EPO13_06590 [Actinomycetota bacterium]|nr:MAG: hypothetical protein EPO13_06590 [Actinomycetota bacterium]